MRKRNINQDGLNIRKRNINQDEFGFICRASIIIMAIAFGIAYGVPYLATCL